MQTDINTKNNFATQNVLKDLLDALTFIEPIFINREKYKKLNGEILVELNEKERKNYLDKKEYNRKDYKLFLPEEVTDNDKIEIYNILNKKFSEEIGFIDGTKKIKSKIFFAVKDILENKYNSKEAIVDESNGINSDRYLEELLELCKKLFPEEELEGFNLDKIKKELSELTLKEKLEYKRDYISLLRKQQNGQNTEKIISQETEFHFDELFFKKGINNLRFGLNIMTKGEAELIEKKSKIEVEGVTINMHQENDKFDDNEQLLRNKIGIDIYKEKITHIRNKGDHEALSVIELEAANKIISELHNNFPYQLTTEGNGDKPSKIQESKELYCLGYSIVGHAFLKELGIQHKGLMIDEHSSLEVNIGGKSYLFDGSITNTLAEFTYSDNKVSVYKDITFNNGKSINNYAFNGDINKVLLAQLYVNLVHKSNNEEESLILVDRSININPMDPSPYINKCFILNALGRYEESLKINDKIIQLNPMDPSPYIDKCFILNALGRYEESLKINDKIIQLIPHKSRVYNRKRIPLIRLGKTGLSKLYGFAAEIIEGKEKRLGLSFRKEKKIIKQLIHNKKYSKLAEYLLSLEK